MLRLPPTVSPIEILWTCVTLVGTVISALNVLDAWRDLVALRDSGRNGALKITAVGEYTDQLMLMVALAGDAMIGCLAMLSMPGREPDGDLSLASYLVPWIMIVGAVSLIWLSYNKRDRRKRLMDILRGHPEHT